MRGRYDAETRAKAVRLYREHVGDYGSPWAAMKAISARLGMTAETLRQWVRQSEVDIGQRPGLSTESAQELRELRRKCRVFVGRHTANLSGPSVSSDTARSASPRPSVPQDQTIAHAAMTDV